VASMREIRTRIKSVKSTQQITKAMKMVAVSKLRRVQAGMEAMRPFAEKSQEIMSSLTADPSVGSENELMKPRREIKKVCYVLMLGNRGLCGVYNSALMHFFADLAAEEQREYALVVCGRWGRDVIKRLGIPVERSFTELSDTPNAEEALEVSEYLKQLYLSGGYDEIALVYQHYVSALKQVPIKSVLLPCTPEGEGKKSSGLLFEFCPDPNTVLDSVLELYINNKVFSTMLEAKCGEHSARMTAMTSAADSTKELIAELDLKLNRARQAAITTEISEIVGGAAALNKK